MKEKRIRKIVIFLSALLIFSTLFVIARNPLATGYELSIYNAYPWYFWLLVIISLLVGSIVILSSESRKMIFYGFLFLLTTNMIFLCLPFFRGYFIYSTADQVTHIGYVKDIIESQQIQAYNHYPLQHVFIAILNHVTIIPIRILSRFLSILFYLIFTLSLYIFLRTYSINRFRYTLVMGTLLIFGTQHVYPLPNILSFLILPLILFTMVKISQVDVTVKRFKTLLFILILSIIFFHPITSLYFLVIVVVFVITNKFEIHFNNRISRKININNLIFVLASIWFFWSISFRSIQHGISRTLHSLFYGGTINPAAEAHTETLRLFDIALVDILQTITFRFGIFIMSFLLTAIYLIYVMSTKEQFKNFLRKKEVPFLLCSLIFFVIWSGINFFLDFLTYTRVFKFVTFFSILSIGAIFGLLIKNETHKNLHFNIFFFFVIFILIISIFSVYPSPPSFRSNDQLTLQENEGMAWFFEKRNESEPIWDLGIKQHRMAHLIYGRSHGQDNIRRHGKIEDHFGYVNHDNMGKNYSGYLIMTDRPMEQYENIMYDYEEYWSFNQSDFQRLERDESVNKVYDNGFFYTYNIRGER